MDRDKFKQELETAQSRLALHERKRSKLVDELSDLDRKIEETKRDIRALAVLSGESEDLTLGLTAACREIFSTTDLPLSQTEVKNRLEQMGFPISQHKHALASIGKTLRRLQISGDLVSVTLPDQRIGFRRKK